MMDEFDFEELIADMLDITDEQREDDDFLTNEFYERFNIEPELAYEFARHLILHTAPIQAGLSKKHFHAFVSKNRPIMLMKTEVVRWK